MRRRVIIVDIDGTIADETALVEAWWQGEDFFTTAQVELVRNAAPMHDVIDIIDALVKATGAEVNILTARTSAIRCETEQWLKDNLPFSVNKVHMSECINTSHVYYKESVIMTYAPEEVICIFENNMQCCEMFAQHGFRTFAVMEV